jgi:hypothetical protein
MITLKALKLRYKIKKKFLNQQQLTIARKQLKN